MIKFNTNLISCKFNFYQDSMTVYIIWQEIYIQLIDSINFVFCYIFPVKT